MSAKKNLNLKPFPQPFCPPPYIFSGNRDTEICRERQVLLR